MVQEKIIFQMALPPAKKGSAGAAPFSEFFPFFYEEKNEEKPIARTCPLGARFGHVESVEKKLASD